VTGVGPSGPVIGILDLQGDVREHLVALWDIGCRDVRLVKRPADLVGLDGLILPGGESTTLSMLLESTGLFEAIAERVPPGSGSAPDTAALRALPVLGTCAGLVLVAREVQDGRPDQRTFGALDAVVRRNGYGRQLQSFEADVVLSAGAGAGAALPTVFIRAPMVVSAGPEVEVLAEHEGVPVLVRQGLILACAFHPELTPDRRVHRMFVDMCGANRRVVPEPAPDAAADLLGASEAL
jgi:5'-phosphate synthase pdxT subunit